MSLASETRDPIDPHQLPLLLPLLLHLLVRSLQNPYSALLRIKATQNLLQMMKSGAPLCLTVFAMTGKLRRKH
jgi:hypothetical protein